MPVVDVRRRVYREVVLSGAEREFARVGFARTKVADIARAADVSLATVYKTFSGKEEIWNGLHSERMTALLELVNRRVANADSALDRLLAGIAAVAEFLTDHDAYLELSLGAGSGWLTTGSGVGVQRTVWGSGLDMIAAGVEASSVAGELGDLRPRIAAGLVVSSLQVWLADWVDSGRDRDGGEVVADLTAHLRMLLTSPAAQRSG